MTLVRYDGPGRRLEAFGKTLELGTVETFTDAEAQSLRAQPHIHVTLLQEEPLHDQQPPSPHASRQRWADHASSLGIAVTDGMTRADIIAAVQAEPEADRGEGQQDVNPEKEE